jgi:hypothetical protein
MNKNVLFCLDNEKKCTFSTFRKKDDNFVCKSFNLRFEFAIDSYLFPMVVEWVCLAVCP